MKIGFSNKNFTNFFYYDMIAEYLLKI